MVKANIPKMVEERLTAIMRQELAEIAGIKNRYEAELADMAWSQGSDGVSSITIYETLKWHMFLPGVVPF